MPRRPESWLIASNHLQERSPASACTRRLVTLASGCACVCVCAWERGEALQPRGRKWGAASGCRRASSVSFSFSPISFRLFSFQREMEGVHTGWFFWRFGVSFFLNLLFGEYWNVVVVCVNVWECFFWGLGGERWGKLCNLRVLVGSWK